MSELNEQMIELTIEALTGTVYDLCVSPFETILGIKIKIQRLEGIPVYQQQLVHGNTELHDEFCLDEYSIVSGAQLKLLVAMRGGPIHAHRVQLEDPTLLEIAEVLEGQDADHKYTVMLLRDDDALEMAEFVEVVAEESPGHVSPLPQITSSNKETASSIALSKVTRTKMQDLMSQLRGRKPPSVEECEDGAGFQPRGAAKVFILDSRSPSCLLHSSAPSPITPHPSATPNRVQSTVHRRLVFPVEATVEEGSLSHRSHKPTQSSDGDPKRVACRPPPSSLQPRMSVSRATDHTPSHALKPIADRQRRRRLRRPSCLADKTTTTHSQREIGELAREMSQLGLRETERRERKKTTHPLLPKLPSSSSAQKTTPSSAVPQLPEISVSHAPCLTGSGRGQSRPQCALCGRKVGLASTYTCRCGGVFCSRHRYAESHNCSFDYKTQGRETIARGNPLVVAPKLPKI